MLQLILGPSGSGKSYEILREIKARAQEGKKSILIVPEQFTSTTEQRIYQTLGDELSGYVESYSFSSLAKTLLDTYGGGAAATLDDAGRAVLVRRAVEDLRGTLVYYGRQSRSMGFCRLAGQTISELKSAGITHLQLEALARNAASGKEKLGELAAIYAAYEARLAGTALDPTDRVELAAARAQEEFFRDKAVYLDEFDTFNASKRAMLRAILPWTDVTVGICSLGSSSGEMGLFSGAAQVCGRLRQLGHKAGVPVKQRVLEQDYRHQSPDLAAAARILEEQPCPEVACQNLTLFEAEDREGEARAVAAAVLKASREGIPYAEMAVICREPQEYLNPLRYQFRLAGIPLYCDGNISPAQTPPAMAAKAAIQLVRGGLTTSNIMALARTGLSALGREEYDALENYAFTWEPRAEEWAKPFDVTPASYGNRIFPTTQEELDLANRARAFLVDPALKFREEVRGAGADKFTHALYQFLTKIATHPETGEHRVLTLARELRQEKGQAEGDRLVQQWEKLVSLLDQMERLLGSEVLTPAEYGEHFDLLLECADLGSIPQTNQSVILAGAGRMRLDGIRAAFVLGLGEGEFPRTPGEEGLLTHQDRDALLEADQRMMAAGEESDPIELPDCFENKLIREEICFYRALTVASHRLWLSWAGSRGTLPRCAALDGIVTHLDPSAPDLTPEDYAATRAMGIQEASRAWNQSPQEFGTLYKALEGDPGLAPLAIAVDGLECEGADRQALAGLLGQELTLSPSRLERFYNCPFSYFMDYILGVQPRRKAQLTADQGGNLIHWVLEQVVARYAPRAEDWKAFLELSAQELEQLAEQLVAEYVKENFAGVGNRPSQQHQIKRMEANLAQLLAHLQREFSQTRCRPVACELSIGPQGQVEPLSYTDGAGHTVRLVGKVDRVDLLEWEGRSYIRVVDYKTGTKEIDLDQVYSGTDCQMLYYLFTLQQQGLTDWEGNRIQSPTPMGVLYLLVDPRPDEKGRQYKTKGLLLENTGLLREMEPAGAGDFLPVSFKKDGDLTQSSRQSVLGEESFRKIAARLEQLVVEMSDQLYGGDIRPRPLQDKKQKPHACGYCPYGGICGHQPGQEERALQPNDFITEEGKADGV